MSKLTVGDPGQDAALDAILADYREVQRQRDEMLAACNGVMGLIEGGHLVRDISHDTDPGWSIQALKFAQIIARFHQTIARCQPAEKGDA